MFYDEMYMGGVLVHGERANHKYIQKIRTKTGKWRYIYRSKHGAGWRRPNAVNYGGNNPYAMDGYFLPAGKGMQWYRLERPLSEEKGYSKSEINKRKRQIHEETRNIMDLDHVKNDRTYFENYIHDNVENVKKKVKRTLNKLANKIISKP